MIEDLDLTSLPLDVFRKIMGIDPWHFWQMLIPDGCQDVYTHYRWIGDGGPGRYDFIQAILMAEQQLAQKLEYWPGLRYDENELVRMIIPRQPVLYNRTPMKLSTNWQHVQSPGLRTWTLLASVVPAYVGDSASVTAAFLPTGTVAGEIVVCYTGTQIQIRPITVSVDGGMATVTIDKWLMADPDLWATDAVIDPNDSDNFLQLVDIYRVTYDATHAVLLAWEPEISQCGCLDESCQVCTNATHAACAVRGDYRRGLIGWQVAEYNVVTARWTSHAFPATRFPDMAYVSYLHGADTRGDRYMNPYWAQIVSHFAVALMDEAACGCSNVLNSLSYWEEDLSENKESGSHQLGTVDIDNPYGTRRGQVAAWKAVLMHVGD